MTDVATRLVKIQKIRKLAPEILSYELVDPDNGQLSPFSAGAHIDVHVGEALIRQYSLCNRPGETHRYEIGVLKTSDSRGGSVGMHARRVGEMLRISDPKNNFELVTHAKRSLLFAGGIGITPILSMAEHLSATSGEFELHYATRSQSVTPFLERIRQSGFANAVQFYHDDGPATEKLDAKEILGAPESGTEIYVCGPKGFMDWIFEVAHEAGWPDQQLHREYFGAVPSPDSLGEEIEFEVEIASTGAVVTVAPDQTILAALSGSGINIPSSCENGVCGTCLTRLKAGTPDHRDMYLSPDEQAKGDQFTPCCSRSMSKRLVLDL